LNQPHRSLGSQQYLRYRSAICNAHDAGVRPLRHQVTGTVGMKGGATQACMYITHRSDVRRVFVVQHLSYLWWRGFQLG